MPLSPFMGVSVILHVLVIVVYGLRNYIAPQYQNRATKRYCLTVSYCMSACIAAFIFSVVFISGYILVSSSITNEHSSIKIISAYLSTLDIEHMQAVFTFWVEERMSNASARILYVQTEGMIFLEHIAKTLKIWLGS